MIGLVGPMCRMCLRVPTSNDRQLGPFEGAPASWSLGTGSLRGPGQCQCQWWLEAPSTSERAALADSGWGMRGVGINCAAPGPRAAVGRDRDGGRAKPEGDCACTGPGPAAPVCRARTAKLPQHYRHRALGISTVISTALPGRGGEGP